MRPKSVLVYFWISATCIAVGGLLGDLLFPRSDPRIAHPIEHAIAFAVGFFLLWPLVVGHQPERRVRSFYAYAAFIILIATTIAAVRIMLETG